MSDDALYRSIAERHGFSLPDEHRQMNARGFFCLNRPACAREFTTPGDSYLWLNDMEWYSLREIADFEFPGFYEPHLQHLVPFAFNAAGDYWCWQTDKTDTLGTRVLLCPHDYALARIYAPNFAAALYRQALEYACYDTDFAPDRIEDRAFLHRWAIDLACVFPSPRVETLRELEARSPTEWTDRWGRPHESLLSEHELKSIELEQINFAELDAELPWLFQVPS